MHICPFMFCFYSQKNKRNKMSDINGNCNLQTLDLNFTYENEKICIKCGESKENSQEVAKICVGPGHFNFGIRNITKLDLSYSNLCSLPDCLQNLPLKKLDVSNNELKIIPDCLIRGLVCIEELDLSNNQIREFEEEPGCCCKLKFLNLSNNLIVKLPIWIQDVSAINLRELYYNKNVIGNTNEGQFGKVASYNLKKMVFCNTKLTNANFDFIKSVRTLQYLDLSNDAYYLINTIVPFEKLFEKSSWYDTLKVLNLGNLDMSFIPENISNIVNLKELYLNKNNLLYLNDSLCELGKLEVLDLSQNQLCCLPSSFEKLTELKVLKLQFNQLCKIDIVYRLKNLIVLDLYHNELDDFCDNFRTNYIDLEKNLIDTKTLTNYVEKKHSYRSEYAINDRSDGPVIEDKPEYDEHCDSSVCYSSYSSELEDGEIESRDSIVEMETWDDEEKVKCNPDITSSDEEWDGHFRYPLPKRKPVNIRFSPDCYKIYEDCAE